VAFGDQFRVGEEPDFPVNPIQTLLSSVATVRSSSRGGDQFWLPPKSATSFGLESCLQTGARCYASLDVDDSGYFTRPESRSVVIVLDAKVL
jgi:hypothetical protein